MSNEIIFDGLVLRENPPGLLHAWIRKGFYGPAEYRGSNDIIPEAAGELFGEPWLAWKRTVIMPIQIKGSGATEVDAQQDFLARSESLLGRFQLSQAAPLELQVHAPLYGIATGYRKLNVRYVGDTGGDPIDGIRQLIEVRLECVDSPPEWVAVP